MPRPCDCDRVAADGVYRPGGCRLCWLWHHDPRYRERWGGDPAAAAAPPPARGLCHHLGVRTEFRAGCSGWSCRHACDRGHPAAVPGGACQSCPDWEAQ